MGANNNLQNITHIFVPIQWQNLDFQRHMSWSFCVQWVQLRWETIVRFVDIGGIDDHHCLNCQNAADVLEFNEYCLALQKSDIGSLSRSYEVLVNTYRQVKLKKKKLNTGGQLHNSTNTVQCIVFKINSPLLSIYSRRFWLFMYEIEMSKYKISRDLVYVMIWGERLLFFDLLILTNLNITDG
jgi:hypothetical protein